MSSQSFTDKSVEVTRRFLQTVVLVDDRAEMIDPAHPRGAEPKSTLVTPTIGKTQPEDSNTETENTDSIPESSPVDRSHKLDAKMVIDSFAKEGLVCSVMQPTRDDITNARDFSNNIVNLARRADILIMDWELSTSPDRGDYAMQLIENTIENNADQENRVQLIAVYTGDKDLDAIQDKLVAKLETKYAIKKEENFWLSGGRVGIVIYAKEETKLTSNLMYRMKTINELPETLIHDYTRMTTGLVSNVALSALSEIRNNTHRLLTKLGPSLDAPFLAHKALLSVPADAETYVCDLIVSELRSLIDIGQVGRHVNDEAVKAWLNEQAGSGREYTLHFASEDVKKKKPAVDLSPKQASDLVNNGLEAWSIPEMSKKEQKQEKKETFKTLTALFSSLEEREELDCEYAQLTCLDPESLPSVREESSPVIRLTLGTIISKGKVVEGETKYEYWLCVQPRCDSIRLTNATSFPFLQLRQTDANEAFDFVVKDPGGSYIKLKTNFKICRTLSLSFVPQAGDNGTIVARKDSGYYFFNINGEALRWVAQLKYEHAQRIANRFAATFSRVGLDESEWLRRWGGVTEE